MTSNDCGTMAQSIMLTLTITCTPIQQQALDKLRREARDRQLRSLEQYYQKLCSEDDAKFHRSSVERLLKHFGLNS